ncbi:MAG: helix-turn-helix domain-containing protein [Candidatus Gastranaerophilales bacterium]|nr:helix-turn-helix domain-containing protein [Candidatus Gastranaerophilales bacterium]
MSNIKKLLGEKIKSLRKAQKLTQEQLAEMVDIDQRTLSAIECGINFPTKNFVKIAQALKVDLKELFDFDNTELSDDEIKQEIINLLDCINSRDLKIVYKLIKSMLL